MNQPEEDARQLLAGCGISGRLKGDLTVRIARLIRMVRAEEHRWHLEQITQWSGGGLADEIDEIYRERMGEKS